MAATYDRNKYGARIWLEHFRGVLPDGPFKAYGDVLAVKAEEVELDGKKKLALFAQIEPTNDLVAMNKAKQKIFTSIEVREKFADSGKAYLLGLAVTDTPASLGTEVLSFSAKNPDASPFKGRKQDPDDMYAEAVEVELEFEEVEDTQGVFNALKGKVSELLGKSKDKEGKDAANFNALGEMIEDLATHGAQQAEAFAAEKGAREKLQGEFDKLRSDFTALVQKLERTPETPTTAKKFSERPPATGGDGRQVTDC
ncbi:Phage capsid scaffolding protein (GPO) serine peptidase [compost metagenome]